MKSKRQLRELKISNCVYHENKGYDYKQRTCRLNTPPQEESVENDYPRGRMGH